MNKTNKSPIHLAGTHLYTNEDSLIPKAVSVAKEKKEAGKGIDVTHKEDSLQTTSVSLSEEKIIQEFEEKFTVESTFGSLRTWSQKQMYPCLIEDIEQWLSDTLSQVIKETEEKTIEKAIEEVQALKKENKNGDSYVSTHNISLSLAITSLLALKLKEQTK